jgi:hypothetical protein
VEKQVEVMAKPRISDHKCRYLKYEILRLGKQMDGVIQDPVAGTISVNDLLVFWTHYTSKPRASTDSFCRSFPSCQKK